MLLIPQPDSGSPSASRNTSMNARVKETRLPARLSNSSLPRKRESRARPGLDPGGPILVALPPMSALLGFSTLDVRIDMGLRFAAGMGDGALLGVAHGLSIAPERARLIIVPPRLPGLAPLGEFCLAEVDAEGPLLRIEADHVAVLQQPDRPADRGLR